MPRSHFARTFVLGVILTLSAQAAWAGPNRAGNASGSAWDLVTHLWTTVTASWSEVGCWLDPNGSCGTSQAPPPDTEVGCWIDPHGSCGTAQAPPPPPELEVGCIIDPHGGCGTGQ